MLQGDVLALIVNGLNTLCCSDAEQAVSGGGNGRTTDSIVIYFKAFPLLPDSVCPDQMEPVINQLSIIYALIDAQRKRRNLTVIQVKTEGALAS